MNDLKKYSEEEIQKLVNSFKKNEIPFSILLLGNYARTKNKYSKRGRGRGRRRNEFNKKRERYKKTRICFK